MSVLFLVEVGTGATSGEISGMTLVQNLRWVFPLFVKDHAQRILQQNQGE